MKKLNFSINSWIFGPASIEEIAKRSREIGVDGIDVSGEPDTTDLARVKKAVDENGLKVFAINGNFLKEDRIVCHKDPAMRASAVEYGKKLVDMAHALRCGKALIVPAQVERTVPFISKEADWENAVESVKSIAAYGADKGVTIMLECVNKYEVSQVGTLKEGVQMAADTGMANVKVIGDTFHMQLEEPLGIANAIRGAGKELAHLHLGDNTRDVPGKGAFNWREILIALNDIDYEEAVSFEPLPRRLTSGEIFAGKLPIDELSADLKYSLDYLNLVMAGI